MPALDSNEGLGPTPADGRPAIDVGRSMYQLALRYWSEGRPEDALRLGLQGAKVLRQAGPGSSQMADVTSMLGSIVTELRSTGSQDPLVGEAQAFLDAGPLGPTV
jgi:hypothetical protein